MLNIKRLIASFGTYLRGIYKKYKSHKPKQGEQLMSVKRVDEPSSDSAENSDSVYPIIKKGNKSGTIVLFNAENTGTCLESGDSKHKVGRFSDTWKEKYFSAYDERVLLKNG